MKENKLGFGIITISIIQLIFNFFSIIGSLFYFSDNTKQILGEDFLNKFNITTTSIIISLVITILITISLILILFKKLVGIYAYIITIIISINYSIIANGFNLNQLLLSLIIPVILLIFLFNKKSVFIKENS
ncbi:MAG: hypothetical protein RSD22_09720 [Romboutsia sp.]